VVTEPSSPRPPARAARRAARRPRARRGAPPRASSGAGGRRSPPTPAAAATPPVADDGAGSVVSCQAGRPRPGHRARPRGDGPAQRPGAAGRAVDAHDDRAGRAAGVRVARRPPARPTGRGRTPPPSRGPADEARRQGRLPVPAEHEGVRRRRCAHQDRRRIALQRARADLDRGASARPAGHRPLDLPGHRLGRRLGRCAGASGTMNSLASGPHVQRARRRCASRAGRPTRAPSRGWCRTR
jgi:hypothetical protein